MFVSDEATGKRVLERAGQNERTVLNLSLRGVVPTVKENLFHWELLVNGPIASPYEGYKFIIDVDFPEQFPFKFPLIKFRTPIYHPNIKEGLICQ